jgi:hypothetical protein
MTASETSCLDAGLASTSQKNPSPKPRQDDQLINLIIFVKQRTYLATLPDPPHERSSEKAKRNLILCRATSIMELSSLSSHISGQEQKA